MQPNINNYNSLVRPRSIDQQWLREQLETVIEWALDIATKLSLRDPSDVAAIDHVKDFIRKYLLGQRAEVPVGDVLTTLGILISGIYIEDERTALSVLAPLQTMLRMPSELPAMLRVRSLKTGSGDSDDEPAAEPAPDGADGTDDAVGDDRDDDGDDDLEDDDLEELDDVPLRRFHRR
jgi:hypothetical protein